MNTLFGLSTATIMLTLVTLFGAALLTFAAIALANRAMFRMGLRNIPRRGTQTALVVAGLTLSTLVVTAAFTTGDTVDYSFRKSSLDILQRSDLELAVNGDKKIGDLGGLANDGPQQYVPAGAVDALDAHFAGDPDIDGFLPYLYQQAPVSDSRTGITRSAVELAGFDAVRQGSLGGLTFADGTKVDLAALAANDVLVSEKAAAQLHAKPGDTLNLYFDGQPHAVRVAGIVRDELASGVLGISIAKVPGGIALPLTTLQQLTGRTGELTNIRVALKGGIEGDATQSDRVTARLESYLSGDGAQVFGPGVAAPNHVVELKRESIKQAEQSSSVFTAFFLVLGLFSMAAGVMLVFMIFVMLAAERRAEMGMARAVGAQRRHLVQSFIAEGVAYSLVAGVVGAGLGVLASLGMTVGLLKYTGGDTFALVHGHVTLRSVVIGYTLGVVVTFVTVTFASLKATHVNIVAAIRNMPEDERREGRRRTSWRWIAASVPMLLVPPLGLWFLLRKGFGLPKALILGPAGIVFGVLLMMLGKSSEILFPFALGISLLPLCVAGIARYFGAPNRFTWTTVGLLLAAYWLLPPAQHDRLFGHFDSDIEMFVLSGIMVVIAATLVIVFNARLLMGLFTGGPRQWALPALLGLVAAGFVAAGVALGDAGDGLGQLSYLAGGLAAILGLAVGVSNINPGLAPAVKMAVAYPLSNRFRTGMSIAMFSIIVFSLTVFSIIVTNFGAVDGGDAARGNLDVVATAGAGQGVGDVRAALATTAPQEAEMIAASGRVSAGQGVDEVRQAGAGKWVTYPVVAADDGFLGALQPALDARARGYTSDAEVLEAVRTQPGLALVDPYVLGSNDVDLQVDAGLSDHVFTPFQLDVRDAATGKQATVTVIGALKTKLDSPVIGGVYLPAAGYTPVFGEPVFQRTYLRLQPGSDARTVATSIESAFGTQGVSATSVKQVLDENSAADRTFQRMFQAFMALGLVVGIAGLGVIAFRSVVERRQQIGMLRAIGFQRRTVALTFLMESSFVAAMGILSGVAGGAIVARNLFTSSAFTDGQSVTFSIPWAEVVLLVAAAYVFSLLMTWWPSRDASRVPVAEALRYE